MGLFTTKAGSRYALGSPLAHYNIAQANLEPPPDGLTLTKVTLTAGYYITGGIEAVPGKKDTPIHITRESYSELVQFIDRKFVVLWDESDRRAWLVNATSALLHLVRASLDNGSRQHPDMYKLCAADLEAGERHLPGTSGSALKVITDKKLLALSVYHLEDYSLQTYIKRRMSVFETLLNHQEKVKSENGINMKIKFRPYLEGWDFVDLSKSLEATAQATKLDDAGSGWADMIRAMGAVVLMGRNFGDILRPVSPHNLCPQWSTLPKNACYLAASGADLERLWPNQYHDISTPRTYGDLVWHCSNNKSVVLIGMAVQMHITQSKYSGAELNSQLFRWAVLCS